MTVLCGTDLSDNAQHAVRAAAAFARALGEPLLLAHVVEEGAFAGAETIFDAWSAAAALRLEELARTGPCEGLAVQTRVLRGTPDESLSELAASLPASLVVVGFLGRRSAERWRAGSLPARLVRAATVPVLVVRDAAGFEAAARGERSLRVLLAADFSLASDAAVGWLPTLRRLGSCEITLLHGYDPGAERQRPGALAPDEPGEETEARLLQELRARVGETLPDDALIFRAIPAPGGTAETVAWLAEQEACDLVVVGGHGRRGYVRTARDSVCERLVALAPASVLRVPVSGHWASAKSIPRIANVLAPTDLSDLGNEAVRYAYAMTPPGSTVHLLHVVEPTPLPNPLYAHYGPGRRSTPEERAGMAKAIEAALRELTPGEAARRGIETRVHVALDGSPAEAIRAAAVREDVDAICMGTHGRSGLSRFVGGSVAREIAGDSPRPLLLVHPSARGGSTPRA